MTDPLRPKAIPLSLLMKRRRQQKKRQNTGFLAPARQVLVALALLASVLLAGMSAYLGMAYASITRSLPSLDEINLLLAPETGSLQQPTRFYDRSGQHILFTLENIGIERSYLHLDLNQPEHFSPHLIQTIVASVQPDFWSSPGFSWRYLTAVKPSTIAERLVNNLFPVGEGSRFESALRMRLLAAQLVSTYGRTQVLEWYLNSAYFGHLAYGADSAARLYLGKSAAEINLAESALLSALIDTPALNPLDAPQAALERKEEVLSQLAASGFFNLQDIEKARLATLSLRKNQNEPSNEFLGYALRQLESKLNRQQIERGGLKVTTTLDFTLQQQFNCTVNIQLLRLQGDPSAGISASDYSTCESALLLPTLNPGQPLPVELRTNGIILNPQTGEILAWLGEQSSQGFQSNKTIYEPGSLLTPFVAAAAFVRGMGPASLVWDVPEGETAGEEQVSIGAIQNPDGLYHGAQRLRYAIANDYLAAIARLFRQVGSENIWLLAQTLGIRGLAQNGDTASLLASGGEVSLPSIAQAYSTFANLGNQYGWETQTGHLEPACILSVEDIHGRVIFKRQESASKVLLSPPLAYLVHDMLSDEIARQPSLGHPNALEIGRPTGAKIGQVNGSQQIWTVGYSPERLAVIWLGLPDDGSLAGEEQLKPAMATGIWHAIMQYALQGFPAHGWQAPPEIIERTVCTPSGQLPTADCPLQVNEVFLLGNEPYTYDTLYKTYYINRETGKLATVFTPLELVEEKTFLVPPSEFQNWAVANGLPLPPSDYDLIQALKPLPGVKISSPAPFAHIHGKVSIEGAASGDDFKSYRLQIGEGLNPRTWLQIGMESDQPITGGTLGVWDTQGLEGLYVIRLTVLRSDKRLESHIIQVSVDNDPPLAAVTFPAEGQEFTFSAKDEILFLANASDAIGIERLVWVLDGKTIGESNLAPFYLTWTITPGEYTLQVDAFDLAGNMGSSEEVHFTVSRP